MELNSGQNYKLARIMALRKRKNFFYNLYYPNSGRKKLLQKTDYLSHLKNIKYFY
jgi:hypothetical protein